LILSEFALTQRRHTTNQRQRINPTSLVIDHVQEQRIHEKANAELVPKL
jgi:hypothetical protein